MNKHSFWMIIGCTAPLLLIFLLPLFGITGNYTFIIFIVLFFGLHLMMMGKHEHNHQHSNQSENKEDKNE
jgi:cell division protein FtsW (lipid II flippase)